MQFKVKTFPILSVTKFTASDEDLRESPEKCKTFPVLTLSYVNKNRKLEIFG
jgi:hypothetical protein